MYGLLWRIMKKALAVTVVSAALANLSLPSSAASTVQAAPAVKEGTIELGPVSIYYLDTGGDGETILLMHPASAGSDAYRKHQIGAFAAAGYRVIAYDRPNFGKTRYDPVASPLQGTTTDDLDAFTRQLGLNRFHIVGTGAGGYIGMDFTLSFPKRVRSLVIANAAMDIMDNDTYSAMIKRPRPEGFYNMPIEFQELSASFRTGNPDGVKAWLENYTASRVKPRGPGQPEKNVTTLKGIAGTKVPMLFISGEADNYAPPPLYREAVKHLPNAELVTIPESAHASYWERPDDYNKAVLGFLVKHH